MKTQINYKDGTKISQMVAVLKKESKPVRLKVSEIVKKLTEVFPKKPEDFDKTHEFEFDDNERISMYRAVISICSQEEYDQVYISWGQTICQIFKCEKQFLEKFGGDIDMPKDFKFDEEFDIIEEK